MTAEQQPEQTPQPELTPVSPVAGPGDPRWAALAAPFDGDVLEWKPQPMGRIPRDADERLYKGRCQQGMRNREERPRLISADDYYCGGYHVPSIHLAYVGHAELTNRLNEVCSPAGWDWEPVAVREDGTPKPTDGGLWVRLTVLGVTKLGFGDPGSNSGPNGVKETIGDALRNAGIRFGIATYLWSKSERSAALKYAEAAEREDKEQPRQAPPEQPAQQAPQTVSDPQRQAAPQSGEGAPAAPPPASQADSALTAVKRRHKAAIEKVHPDWTAEQKADVVARAFAAERTDSRGRPTTIETATVEDWQWLATYWEDQWAGAQIAGDGQPEPDRALPAGEPGDPLPSEQPRSEHESAVQA